MRIGLILLFVFAQQCVFAQITDSVKITGQIVPDTGVTFKPDKADVRLVPYNDGESVSVTQVNNDGSFVIKVAVKVTGMYDLKYKSYKMSLLLSPAEPVYMVIIKTDARQEVKSMRISGSKENDAYRAFKKENMRFKDLLRDFRADCEGNDKNCVDKYKKKLAAQNELMEYLKMGYKGTFTSGVLANLGEVPQANNNTPLLAQMQSGFFDASNFLDTALYRTSDLSNKISWYIDYLADTNTNSRLSFISNLMSRTKGSKEAQKNLLTVLFNNFLDEYREPYVESLVKWAKANQSLLDANQPVLAAKLKLVEHVLPGLLAPDVSGENLSHQIQTLQSVAKSNKLTFLIFWESDCPHCRKAMPDFIRIYKEYHARGLEVFAASLDNDKTKWKQFIDYNHLTWTNIVLPEKSSAHADYFIQYTPTVVLLDDKGKIVHRFIRTDDLEKTISAVLDK